MPQEYQIFKNEKLNIKRSNIATGFPQKYQLEKQYRVW